MPSFIPKLAKIAVFWAKWTIFGPKMSQKCPKLFFSLTALKVDEVGQVSSILDIEKV